jgi:hypothetical protein
MNGRGEMVQVLKELVVPKLRMQGFKGSFPHFRKNKIDNIHLLTFQFDKWGGGFAVELACCPAEGVTMYWGEKVSANKVTTHHINTRYRLGAKDTNSDHWFRYDGLIKNQFKSTADELLKELSTIDDWFSKLNIRR